MTGPRTTGVWISANSATVLRWSPELTVRHRIDSTVPGRHRSTGSAPTEKHPAGEGHRDEHMRTFFAQVAHVLPVDDDLLLLGDGEVVEHFAEHVARMTTVTVASDASKSKRAAHSPSASCSPGSAPSPDRRPNASCPADRGGSRDPPLPHQV